MYMIVAKSASDAERRRIEYIFDKRADTSGIEKPDGVIRFVGDGDVGELVQELLSRVSGEVLVYRITPADLKIEKGTKEIEMEIKGSMEVVEGFVNYLMARVRAVLTHEMETPRIKEYSVHSRKGLADIQVAMREEGVGEKTHLSIKIEAYEPALSFLYVAIREQLEVYRKGAEGR